MRKIYQKDVSKLLLTIVMSFIMLIANAQNRNVSGRVTDPSGAGIPSAGVSIKGTKISTLTDADGNFTISAKKGDVLMISYVGFTTKEIVLADQSALSINLEENNQALDEVVVVGYGTIKKSNLTGSVSKLDAKVLETGIRSNPGSALAGTIPGLRVQQTSGRPGAVPNIVLRGGTSFAGAGSPLVVVDGIVRGLGDINQDDIESIEVLKDASAASIYGARAANGVVLITTKKGKAGQSNISLKSKVGINKLNLPFEFLTGEEYIYWSRKAIETSGSYDASRLTQLNTTGPFGTGNLYKDANGVPYDGNVNAGAVWSPMFRNAINEELLGKGWLSMLDPLKTNAVGAYDPNGTNKEILYKNFDYSEYALRPHSLTQDYNLNMSGGNENGNYYAGLGRYDEKGMPINTFYNRLSFVINGEYRLKPWLVSTSRLNFVNSKRRDPTNSEGNYLTRALGAPPTMRGFNEKGDLLVGRDYLDGNPAVNDAKFIRKNSSDAFTLMQDFGVNLLSNLRFNLTGSLLYDQDQSESFTKDFLSSPNNFNRTRNSSASVSKNLNQQYNAALNYNARFASKHTLDLLVGSEYADNYSFFLSASGSGAPTDDFMDLTLTSSDKDRRSINTDHTQQRILSFISRATFSLFDSKYLITGNFRREGYSRMIDNRWGNYGGVSVGWNVHKEKFFSSLSLDNVVNSLKLRGSYGSIGNISGIGAYTLQGSYSQNRYNSSIGYLLGTPPNSTLSWESLITKEVGLDARLFNKIDVSLAYYHRTTSDKIATLVFPVTAGITGVSTNNGDMQNQGVEVDLGYAVYKNKDWTINLDFNMAYNVNKVLKLPFNGLENNRQGGFQVYDPNTKELIWVGGTQEGQDPNIAYAYQAEGIIRTKEQLDSYALKLRDLLGARTLVHPDVFNALPANQKSLYFPIALGDVMWRDVNGDGTINSFDRVYQGRTVPRWIGGFGGNVRWKSFALSTRFDYALGFVAQDGPRSWFLSNAQGTFNTTIETKDTWSPTNPNAKYPTYYWADQLFKNNTFRPSSMFYNKGDYLALREINLTYSLPASIAKRMKSQGVNFSISGQNLTYFSKSTLYSPESGGIAIDGAGSGGYPLPRTFIFGAQFIF
ncbi:MAG: SusC/RagA family TonB-linked outer membrane protein [Sphingobacteriales bacterium]|nr:MAG: SusC/RagA family TonB-linked outer membrane protein [Sphingobacteriales bacterium]